MRLHRLTVLVPVVLIGFPLISQSLEIIRGINDSRFYDFKKEETGIYSKYYGKRGFIVRLGHETKNIARTTVRFTISHDEYSGQIVPPVRTW
jgi:hypothetical protein